MKRFLIMFSLVANAVAWGRFGVIAAANPPPWLSESWNGSPLRRYTNNQTFSVTPDSRLGSWLIRTAPPSSGHAVIRSQLVLSQRPGGIATTLVLSTNIPAAGVRAAGWTVVAYASIRGADFAHLAGWRIGWISNSPSASVDFGAEFDRDGVQPYVKGRWLFNKTPQITAQPDTEYALAVQLLTNGCRLAAQGGFFSQFGCAVGSPQWFEIYRHDAGGPMPGQKLYPAVEWQYGGEGHLTSVLVYSNFFFGGSQALLDSEVDVGLKTHTPSLAMDSNHVMWASWAVASYDISPNLTIRAAWRHSDGTWSDPVTVVPPGTSLVRYNGSTLSIMGGRLVDVYQKSINGDTNFNLFYKSLSMDDATVVIGPETPIDVTNLNVLAVSNIWNSYNPIVVAPDGSLVLPVQVYSSFHPLGSITPRCFRSTDGGAHWAVAGQISGGGLEPAFVVEQDGKLGCWLRSSRGCLLHSTSTDDGLTWSVATRTSIPNPDNRCTVSSLPDGRTLVFNSDDSRLWHRDRLACWVVAANAVVEQKILLDTETNSSSIMYPAGLYHDGLLSFAWADEDPSRPGQEIGLVYFVEEPFVPHLAPK